MELEAFQNWKRIVVKVGSSTLTHETGMLNIRRVEKLVKVLADLKNTGREIILVSSGAIAVGFGKLGIAKDRPKDTPSRQAAAAVGQCELMYIYDKLFSEYNHTVSQLLLTRDVIDSSRRLENVINTFERLLTFGAIPVVNENDTVSIEELELGGNDSLSFGDNDSLSAIVATICKAQALIILSDIDGLYDEDPRKNPHAKLIPVVEKLDDTILHHAGGAGSQRGTGGMVTKLHAAQIATEAGIQMVICNGQNPENLYRLFDGEPVGTWFQAQEGYADRTNR